MRCPTLLVDRPNILQYTCSPQHRKRISMSKAITSINVKNTVVVTVKTSKSDRLILNASKTDPKIKFSSFQVPYSTTFGFMLLLVLDRKVVEASHFLRLQTSLVRSTSPYGGPPIALRGNSLTPHIILILQERYNP